MGKRIPDRVRLMKVILKEGVSRADVAAKGPNLRSTPRFSEISLRVSMTSRQRRVFYRFLAFKRSLPDQVRSDCKIRVDYGTGEPSIPFQMENRFLDFDDTV